MKPLHPEQKHLTDPTDDNRIPFLHTMALHFSNFKSARMHLFYWAALLLVQINIHLNAPTSSHLMQSFMQKSFDTATLITKTVPYLLSD